MGMNNRLMLSESPCITNGREERKKGDLLEPDCGDLLPLGRRSLRFGMTNDLLLILFQYQRGIHVIVHIVNA